MEPTLLVVPEAEMATLRAIAQAGDVGEDLEFAAPGLQELNSPLVGAAQEEDEEP